LVWAVDREQSLGEHPAALLKDVPLVINVMMAVETDFALNLRRFIYDADYFSRRLG